MTVPGRVEAARLLWSLDPPVWFVRHVTAVAEVAGWLALRASERGLAVDRRLVESAALRHDVDKTKTGRASVPGLPHGEGSAAWLTAAGAAELADAVRDHPVTRLIDEGVAARLLGAPLEVRLVAYADKRAQQRLVSMDQRFATWIRKHGDRWGSATTAEVRGRADELECRICDELGIRPEAVRRLAWTSRALDAAHQTAAGTAA